MYNEHNPIKIELILHLGTIVNTCQQRNPNKSICDTLCFLESAIRRLPNSVLMRSRLSSGTRMKDALRTKERTNERTGKRACIRARGIIISHRRCWYTFHTNDVSGAAVAHRSAMRADVPFLLAPRLSSSSLSLSLLLTPSSIPST